MAQEQEHIFLQNTAKAEKFTTTASGGGKAIVPERERVSHSNYLISRFNQIREQSDYEKQAREAVALPTHQGTYLEFKSSLNADLITKSLENESQGIRLLNIQTVYEREDKKQIRAIVYIPKGKETTFIKKIEDYANDDKNTQKGNPKNGPLVNSIDDVRLAILESFWSQSEIDLIPDEIPTWCEAWLRIDDDVDFEQKISSFIITLQDLQIRCKGRALQFPERAVLLVFANKEQLSSLISSTDLIAEFRIGQEAASFWINESNIEQTEWAEDLLSRLDIVDSDVKVCILDSGVNNGHMLLSPILDDENCLTVNPLWRNDDRSAICPGGHGTLMAGLVGYGDLKKELESAQSVLLTHKLCSVKILPNIGQAEKEHWGDITDQAVYRAEAQNPEKVLLFCLAITSAEDIDKGRPSSWSGSIDIMSYGKARNQRLFIISAGNVSSEYWSNYPNSNRLFSVQNPAQSWNALTVGAYTEKVLISDSRYDHLERVAQLGEISPYTSTSNLWDKKWPIKPEVLFEGGNLVKRDENTFESHVDIELLSTSKHFNIRQFDTINATSAATAQASWLAAKIQYIYPNAWPETTRALIVHSASWTEQMIQQFGINIKSKSNVQELLRTCGYGVTDIKRALYSFENAFTFVAQETIQPYVKEGSKYKTNEMHFFSLPWPVDLLKSLGEVPVRFKITLSYFIEPGAGEIGWKDKYRYQSFGLRFDINNINETEEEFKKRINKDAREDDEDKPDTNAGSGRWLIGKNNRDVGSIHSDIWEGTASEMAECNLIAIYPIIGWWRERHNLKKYNSKARYSLVVSLETPIEDVQLYSTVQTLINVPIEIPIS